MRFKFPFQFRTKYKIAQRGIQTEAQRLDQILSSSYSPSFVYKSKFSGLIQSPYVFPPGDQSHFLTRVYFGEERNLEKQLLENVPDANPTILCRF